MFTIGAFLCIDGLILFREFWNMTVQNEPLLFPRFSICGIGDNTYKLHYATNHLVPGIHGVMGCFDSYTCDCSGPTVDRHDPPLVYDLFSDPSEVKSLDKNDPNVLDIIRKVAEAVASHRESIPNGGAHQFTVMQMLPRPWDRPRCGSFPYYSCTDPYLEQLKTLKEKHHVIS